MRSERARPVSGVLGSAGIAPGRVDAGIRRETVRLVECQGGAVIIARGQCAVLVYDRPVLVVAIRVADQRIEDEQADEAVECAHSRHPSRVGREDGMNRGQVIAGHVTLDSLFVARVLAAQQQIAVPERSRYAPTHDPSGRTPHRQIDMCGSDAHEGDLGGHSFRP